MSFVVKKRIDFSFLGEGWEDCYIVMSPFSWDDNDELLSIRHETAKVQANPEHDLKKENKRLSKLVVSHFVEGKGFDGEKVIDITKENVTQLPMEAFNKILQTLQGSTTPN